MNNYADLIERLEEWAKEIALDGTPSQIGPSSSDLTEAAACIREMVEWRPIETFELSGQAHPVIVAVPDRDGGWLVGEAWLRAEEGDTLWENGWWWAGTSPGQYHDSPIIEMNYGPPKWWKPLPLPPAPGAEA